MRHKVDASKKMLKIFQMYILYLLYHDQSYVRIQLVIR